MGGLASRGVGIITENIYFDISRVVVLAADSPIEAEFVWALRNVGIDHVLLGSDYPQFTLAQTLDALERLDLTQEEKATMRYRNGQRRLKEKRDTSSALRALSPSHRHARPRARSRFHCEPTSEQTRRWHGSERASNAGWCSRAPAG